ncbi:hypothetical protein Poly24_39060 [Rosistilla carotiformis]|uniref:Uncharacterized protein n=1 Tax=Rosistilla carotiformis TaxID=2528017 RepID=A0A518JXA7_9BACT|nr:hypothetical protein Poly24_39060 [Rosistilla carotiformis]
MDRRILYSRQGEPQRLNVCVPAWFSSIFAFPIGPTENGTPTQSLSACTGVNISTSRCHPDAKLFRSDLLKGSLTIPSFAASLDRKLVGFASVSHPRPLIRFTQTYLAKSLGAKISRVETLETCQGMSEFDDVARCATSTSYMSFERHKVKAAYHSRGYRLWCVSVR